MCDLTFSTETDMKEHINTNHTATSKKLCLITSLENWEPENDVKLLSYMPASLDSPLVIPENVVVPECDSSKHTMPLKCESGDYVAMNNPTLQAHIRHQHSKQHELLTFPCHVCGLTFGEMKTLDMHVMNCHPPVPDLLSYLKFIIEQNQAIKEDILHLNNPELAT